MMISLLFSLALLLINFHSANAVTIKAGILETTPLSIVAEWPIGDDTQVGEHFSAKIIEPLILGDNEVIIPANSHAVGRVVNVEQAKSFHRNAKVDIHFEKIVFPDNIQSIQIDADGAIIPDRHKVAKLAGATLREGAKGAILGALGSLKIAGIAGLSSSFSSTLAVGAATGAGMSVVSFAAQNGKSIDIYPGLPMTLNIVHMENQDYTEQVMPRADTHIKANILDKQSSKKAFILSFEIDNKLEEEISLRNIKLIDALGYSFTPIDPLTFYANKTLGANSKGTFTMHFPPGIEKTKQWLVLTDSFNKQEYFRIKVQ